MDCKEIPIDRARAFARPQQAFCPALLILTLFSLLGSCQATPPSGSPARQGESAGPVVPRGSVIRTFPSALLPPVSEPYLFYWDFGPAPFYQGSVANAQGSTEASGPAQVVRGRLPVYWTYGPQWPYGKTRQHFIDFYLHVIESFRAYLIDEWQGVSISAAKDDPLSFLDPFGIEGAIEGIDAARKRSTGSVILVAWRGEDTLLPLVRKGGVDFLLVEAFSRVPRSVPRSWAIGTEAVDSRIDKARSWGILDRTIPWLGQILAADEYHDGEALNVEELERQIRHYRRIAPQMPGVAFYGNSNPSLADAADALCRKYFVDPAPLLAIRSPAAGRRLARDAYTVAFEAAAQEGRKITSFRGFIDNRLVYEGTGAAFSWDFSQETPGSHLITVHAIDDAWNRASTQIGIELE